MWIVDESIEKAKKCMSEFLASFKYLEFLSLCNSVFLFVAYEVLWATFSQLLLRYLKTFEITTKNSI